jgi:hypothetical protein
MFYNHLSCRSNASRTVEKEGQIMTGPTSEALETDQPKPATAEALIGLHVAQRTTYPTATSNDSVFLALDIEESSLIAPKSARQHIYQCRASQPIGRRYLHPLRH